ncbi:FCD domain-containing protein [Paraburkholderia sediminicola]|uniref:FCD domain-containing protein n=1 Tax=Paraburkholderia sediminicola TaxID=458836 RepID=UPI0038B8275D
MASVLEDELGATADTAGDIRNGKSTRSTIALSRIRHLIVTGQLAPGERLVVSSLADAIEGGQTPVREALMRLVSEGLVTLENQRGFSVAPVSRRDLEDVTAARVEIEVLLVRWAIERGDDQWEADVIGAFHKLRKLQKIEADGESIRSMWEERHREFHFSLVAKSGNQTLLDVRDMLYQRADRYRRLSVRYLQAPRDDVKEHEDMMQAALSRDVAIATALIRSHIETTTRILLAEVPSKD